MKYTCSAAFWRRTNAPFERICRRMDGRDEIEAERRDVLERHIRRALGLEDALSDNPFRRLLGGREAFK